MSKQADAGRDCRTCLATPNSQARTGTGKKNCPSDHKKDWQPFPVDPYSAEGTLTIHTGSYTFSAATLVP